MILKGKTNMKQYEFPKIDINLFPQNDILTLFASNESAGDFVDYNDLILKGNKGI